MKSKEASVAAAVAAEAAANSGNNKLASLLINPLLFHNVTERDAVFCRDVNTLGKTLGRWRVKCHFVPNGDKQTTNEK